MLPLKLNIRAFRYILWFSFQIALLLGQKWQNVKNFEISDRYVVKLVLKSNVRFLEKGSLSDLLFCWDVFSIHIGTT